MSKTRAFAWIVSAAAAGVLLAASPAAAQYGGGYAPQPDRYHAPMARSYQPASPPHYRPAPAVPRYAPAPNVRKYGHGPSRHWRRWTGRPHPGWEPYPARDYGWGRPRYPEYR